MASRDADAIWTQLLNVKLKRARTQALRKKMELRKQPKFPQFKRFPPELRRCVWEAFCPALAATSRVYCFDLTVPGLAPDGAGGQRFTSGVQKSRVLQDQTEHARIVMAVHRESRHFATPGCEHV